jgi:autotransporter-associated beta strand protein
MKKRRFQPFSATLAWLALSSVSAHAADLTWDTATGDGGGITAGSGAWNTTGTNLVWNNGTTNVAWTQTNTTTPLNAAIFAGTDGAVDAYTITLGAQMAAQALTFNNSGYRITGNTLSLRTSDTTNGSITVATGKTATINSILSYQHNRAATMTVGSGGVLNLGGGMPSGNRPQLAMTGEGTINITAGTYSTTIGNRNAAVINQTGGTWTMSDNSAGNLSHSIGNGAGQNVNYTVSGTGVLNALSTNNTGASYTLSLGRNMGNFTSTLTLKSGGTVNVGNNADRFGQINLGSFDGNGNSLLDVQGGTLTIGTGQATNRLYFFAAGANAGKTATMTQSGGTATINGIQFGANTGDNFGGVNGANAYDGTALATLQLSGGSLYVGAQGITRGSAAAALPVTIQLQGGTLGAAQNWSSAMDMKLGTAATIRAQDSGSNARNITLSGILSDDGAVNGSLTKTGLGTLTLSGANTYTGGTVVNAGTLLLSGATNLPTSGTLQVNAGGNFSLADGTARSTSTAALGLASGAMLSFDWNGESVDTLTSTVAAITEGTVGIVLNNTSPTGSGGTLISSPAGGLATAGGTRYLLANNTNYTAALTVTDTAVSIGAQSPAAALTDAYWVGGQVLGAPGAMNLSDGTTSNWATDAAGTPAGGVVPGGSAVNVIFGSAVGTQQANVATVTDLNLGSLTFNDSAAVTLGGSYFITLNSTSATAATSAGAGTTVTPGSAITVTSSANAANTINANLILAADQTWNIAGDKSLAIGGAVSGAATLTKADGGTLVLTGVNTYTGNTTVGSGTLQLGGSGQLGNGNYAGAITLGSGASFENAGSATQTLSGAITGTGGTVKLSGNGQLILNNAGNTYGSLRIGDGRVFISSNAGALPAAATVDITGGILVFGTGTSYGNAITVGNGGGIATRNSAGTTLNGVTLAGSGTVIFNNDDARSYGLSITSDLALTGNLTVQIGGSRTNNNPVGGVTLSGKLTGEGALTVASSGQVGSPHFGTGALTLTGANDYSGGTTLNQGTLTIGTGGSLGAATGALAVGNDNTVAAGTNVILNLATAVDTTVGSLSGSIATPASGTNTATINTGGIGRTFTVSQTTDATYAGVIAGGGNFTVGSGSTHALTLSGANTYTGATTVAAGSLIITGAVASTSVVVDGSLGGSGVMASATLSGTGSIHPGNSPGILTAAATDPTGGLDYNFEFTVANAPPVWNAPTASGNDVLRLTAATAPFTAALGGTNTVTIYLNVASLAEGDVFTGGFYTDKDADFLSSISSGTFQYFLADAGGATTYGGNTYTAYSGPYGFELATVAQTADFGSGVVNGFATQFTVVPEPGVGLLGGLGLLALLRRRRHRTTLWMKPSQPPAAPVGQP